eukprot:14608660-Alexandrium_andersonii.AAC.1
MTSFRVLSRRALCPNTPGPFEECAPLDSVFSDILGALESQGFRLARCLRPDAPGQLHAVLRLRLRRIPFRAARQLRVPGQLRHAPLLRELRSSDAGR